MTTLWVTYDHLLHTEELTEDEGKHDRPEVTNI